MNPLEQKLLGLKDKEEHLTLDMWMDYPDDINLIQLNPGKYKLVFKKRVYEKEKSSQR